MTLGSSPGSERMSGGRALARPNDLLELRGIVRPKVRSWFGTAGVNAPHWAVHCGDARDALSMMPSEHFSCVVTSPPYFWQRDYEVSGQIGQESSVAGYVNSICDAMDEVQRVMRRDGVLFLNLGDTYYSAKGKPQGHDPKHNGRRSKCCERSIPADLESRRNRF